MSSELRRILQSMAAAVIVGLSVTASAEAAKDDSDSAKVQTGSALETANSATPAEAGLDEKLGQLAALDVVLRDELGRPVSVKSLVDRPTILTLNYFRCGGICSPQLNGLAKAISRTHAAIGKEFRVITVSFDERDTAEIAAQKQVNYLREVKRPTQTADWRFLTGDAAATRKLADSVGFNFKQVGADFVHPGALMFLSPEGKITRYMYGTSYLPADLELAVQEAARGEAQPSINKWLKFCFSYDPEGRRYFVDITRIAGASVLGIAMVFAFFLLRKGRQSKANGPARGK